jgi:hypothetical protein
MSSLALGKAYNPHTSRKSDLHNPPIHFHCYQRRRHTHYQAYDLAQRCDGSDFLDHPYKPQARNTMGLRNLLTHLNYYQPHRYNKPLHQLHTQILANKLEGRRTKDRHNQQHHSNYYLNHLYTERWYFPAAAKNTCERNQNTHIPFLRHFHSTRTNLVVALSRRNIVFHLAVGSS